MRTRLRPGRLRNRLRSRRCVPHGGSGARGSRPRWKPGAGRWSRMGWRRRGNCDDASGAFGSTASPAIFPSKTPRPAPHAVLRAVVGRSSDSWARRPGLLLFLPLPGARPQCQWQVRSQLPLRGSAGMAIKASPGFPFNPLEATPTGTDGPQDSGGTWQGQCQYLVDNRQGLAPQAIRRCRPFPGPHRRPATADPRCAVKPRRAGFAAGLMECNVARIHVPRRLLRRRDSLPMPAPSATTMLSLPHAKRSLDAPGTGRCPSKARTPLQCRRNTPRTNSIALP